MKTSFYFALWIAIYPLLGMLDNSFVNNNSFIIALAIVWGLSWLLPRLMPNVFAYENASQIVPMLEATYAGDVKAVNKMLTRETILETVTSIYFTLTTIAILIVVFVFGVSDWIALLVFGFFTIAAIARANNMVKARHSLSENPTQEQCADIAESVFQYPYASYAEARREAPSAAAMMPPRPKYYEVFQVFSAIVAVVAIVMGVVYILQGVDIFTDSTVFGAGAFAGMSLLYGTLAAYFGIRDLLTLLPALK